MYILQVYLNDNYHMCFGLQHNDRRYGSVALCRGGAPCPAPNVVKVRVFLHSWYGAGLCGYYFILALSKTVTPGGSPRQESPAGVGQAVAPTTKLSSFASKLSRHGATIAYTDLLPAVFFLGYSYCLVQQFYIEVDLSI